MRPGSAGLAMGEIVAQRVSLVVISSPLGLLWQSHDILKADGSRRDRDYPNLSETLGPEESFIEGAARGVHEEIGLNVEFSRLRFTREWEEEKISISNGALKRYTFGEFDLELSLTEAQSISLVAEEPQAFTYFEWRRSGGRPRSWPKGMKKSSVTCADKDREILAILAKAMAWGEVSANQVRETIRKNKNA